MATDLRSFPDSRLTGGGEFAADLRARGIEDYLAAARHVRDLPYGRNSDRSDYRLVLAEGRGTCSTKHALLAALAEEQGLCMELRIGIFLMDCANTPVVESVLRRWGLSAIPEAHCYLAYRGERVDVTGLEGGDPAPYLREEAIEPGWIGSYKTERHEEFLRSWAREHGLNPEHAWRVREECIRALSVASND